MPSIVRTLTPPLDKDGKLVTGWVALGKDYYDVEDRPAIPGDATKVVSGVDRYAKLTGTDQTRVLKSQITRLVATKATPMLVIKEDVVLGDVVVATDITPHKWAGEP